MQEKIAFFDLEVNPETPKILDIGCIRSDEATFHKNNISEFFHFISDSHFLCGHNIIAHDLKYLKKYKENIFEANVIDTLLLSPLLFPQNPYHKLLKDDKLQTEELNNPLNDAKKARVLLQDEKSAFLHLSEEFKQIVYDLLYPIQEFKSFFHYAGYSAIQSSYNTESNIHNYFKGEICENCDVSLLIEQSPVGFAYALALLNSNDRYSITPPWVLKNYPDIERFFFRLRNNPCVQGCQYCNEGLNPFKALQKHFGFSTFRSYGDEPLQEKAVMAAINSQSILAVFPTGGGKSITFQVPALISGENAKALTVVIFSFAIFNERPGR